MLRLQSLAFLLSPLVEKESLKVGAGAAVALGSISSIQAAGIGGSLYLNMIATARIGTGRLVQMIYTSGMI